MHKAGLVCALAVVAVLAAVGAPSPFLEVLGFQACANYVFNGTVPTQIIQPVGTDSIREARRKGVQEKLEAGLTAAGGNPKGKGAAQNIRDGVDDVFKLNLDAFTLVERTWSWKVQRNPGPNVSLLQVDWTAFLVTLLPFKASDQLKNHEAGHRQIEEDLKNLAATRFFAAKDNIVDKNVTNAEIEAILSPVAAKLMKIGDEAHSAYDAATVNGTQGGLGQQAAATTAFTTAAANNP